VGYVVAQSGRGADPALLRSHVAQSLPEYMVPGAIVGAGGSALDPRTASWTAKRCRLRSSGQTPTPLGTPPALPTKKILCALFAEVLGVSSVGIDDNFFELGGHSLLATRLVSRMRAALGVELAIRSLFEAPTVAQLAERLNNAQAAKPPLRAMATPGRGSLFLLRSADSGFWTGWKVPSPTYHIPVALRLSGPLDPAALEAALGDVVQRHQSLRTIFAETQGVPRQLILEGASARPKLTVRSIGEADLCETLSKRCPTEL